jgi:hypothetical protein
MKHKDYSKCDKIVIFFLAFPLLLINDIYVN